MKQVILLKTTKVNGAFVAGGTILEIGEAIEKEDFESAAELRDKIRLLEKEVN